MAKNIEIRNSTAEFLIFMLEGKEDGIQVMYKNETIWTTQKAMARLFDVGVPAISKHLKNIFESGELDEHSVISKMETIALSGKWTMCNFSCIYFTIRMGLFSVFFPFKYKVRFTEGFLFFQDNSESKAIMSLLPSFQSMVISSFL